MMTKEYFTYPSADGKTTIRAVRWVPEKPKGILQIAHGMVEFADRYDEFASYMAQQGMLVTGNDHLGHGDSVTTRENWGYFADRDSLDVLLRDMHTLAERTAAEYPNLPRILLGHSMGAFLSARYLCRYGETLTGALLMGIGYQPKSLLRAGKLVCSALAKVKGWHHRSRFVDRMAFGGYNKSFEPSRTPRDWLTRDEEQVDRYLADVRCSFVFTLNGYHTLFTAIEGLHDRTRMKEMPKELPVLFVSGEEDPVGDFGRGVRRTADLFLNAGMRDVDVWMYTGRHEVLNETDREITYAELGRWICDIAEGRHTKHDPDTCTIENCSCKGGDLTVFTRKDIVL